MTPGLAILFGFGLVVPSLLVIWIFRANRRRAQPQPEAPDPFTDSSVPLDVRFYARALARLDAVREDITKQARVRYQYTSDIQHYIEVMQQARSVTDAERAHLLKSLQEALERSTRLPPTPSAGGWTSGPPGDA